MKPERALSTMSVLSIVLFSLHWAHDVIRGIDRVNTWGVVAVLVLAVWLYAALLLTERRAGLVILLLLSLLAAGITALHMRGVGLAGGRLARTSGDFFWLWTLIALGVTGMLSVLLSLRGLWSLRRSSTGPAS